MIGLIIILMYLVFVIPLIIRASRLGVKNPPFSKIKGPFLLAVSGIILVTLFLSLIDFQVNFLWFKSIGFLSPFLRRFLFRIVLFLIGFAFSWAIYSLAFYVPKRHEELEIGEKVISLLKKFVPIVLGIFTGLSLSSNFLTVLAFLNRVSTTTQDPIFHLPVTFYMFTYPFISFILSYLLGIFITAFIVEELVYGLYIRRSFPQKSVISLKATNLLSVIAGLIFLTAGLKIYISIYSLLFQQSGAVFGIGYTDFYVRVPMFKILAGLFILASIFLFLYAALPRFTQRTPIFKILIAGFILVVLIYGLLPAAFQFLIVRPTELAREKQFLTYNIQGSREGYALDKINLVPVNDIAPLTLEKLASKDEIIQNFRFWDWRALKDTYQQIQSIRLYYTFFDVDVDRYMLNGKLREVMISARELDSKLLPENSKTWVNLHLKYTHGFGLCMNTVNEFTSEGLPNLLIKDIPPVSSVKELEVKRPEIYFGEVTNNYVFVNTLTEEFNYPKGEENAYSTYEENRGISMNPLNRLIFAMNFDDPNIILSRYLNSDSRLLMIRNIKERVSKIAPYFEFGEDPYIVLGEDGKLYWMGDAFTYSSLYPYSEPVTFFERQVNYVRNSVKYVVDAYTGDTSFYIVDSSDPVAIVLSKIFPGLLKDFSTMPDFLKAHMRYPDEMVQTQGYVYLNYHMSDPEVFYNKEDRWEIAQEKYFDQTQVIIPYYSIVEDPYKNTYGFANIYPFTPYRKSNLIALLIARCDPEDYGKVDVYRFSKDKLIYGPLQIEARVDQDSEISKVLTLWNQEGSEVIRGNLLVIPVNNSVLYLEPVYLQASSGKFPQIKKVVLATQDKLVWGDTFDDAIRLLFGEGYTPPSGQTEDVKELIKLAQTHFEKYKQLIAQGYFEEAGKELKEVENLINKINSLQNP